MTPYLHKVTAKQFLLEYKAPKFQKVDITKEYIARFLNPMGLFR